MINKTIISGLAAFTLLGSPAFAKNESAKGKKADAAMTAYKIDTANSTVGWKGSKATGASHNGTINLKEGQLEVTGKQVTGGNFKADMSTLTDKDLESSPDYQKKLVGHLKSEDFFNIAKFPESTFKITKVEKKSDTEILVKGDLTMIGSTQPVEFPATLKWEGEKLVGTASLKLDRTKWGLKYGSGKFFQGLGDKLINDEFELTLNLTAVK